MDTSLSLEFDVSLAASLAFRTDDAVLEDVWRGDVALVSPFGRRPGTSFRSIAPDAISSVTKPLIDTETQLFNHARNAFVRFSSSRGYMP